ncbi:MULTISPECIES: SRPBCC family protein [unclassified Nocardia]|uniref:SRPBCC family protein n=1 Tax=unclassified Nocardia TaxID=2637762 RepID=UPI001CE4B53E|nr:MULTISPECIES: SRPBCC family protein [unclassified Nocardia]
MTQQLSDKEIRVEFTVDAPPERAYEVFTTGIDSWWPRGHHIGKGQLAEEVIEPRAGGRCFGREADGTECAWGTVLAWEPPRHFAFSWEIGLDWQHDPDPAHASRVDVTFEPLEPGRTAVTLVHSGFENHGKGWESMRDSVGGEGGWPGMANTYAEAAAA